nr:hypothetical protein Iba_scaffold67039CG0010 [Ipomoea batatas]GMD12914.1 hypothetical protein Iba_scaffold40512CG0010 [Ipomoea batatas]GME06915.1 hypothetical protein Iba_scaffold5724CG0040 [Ipomoea batatas]GME19251.1 hypothetical protein Iba_scaffold22277CG0010 [Ipomoea batatas]
MPAARRPISDGWSETPVPQLIQHHRWSFSPEKTVKKTGKDRHCTEKSPPVQSQLQNAIIDHRRRPPSPIPRSLRKRRRREPKPIASHHDSRQATEGKRSRGRSAGESPAAGLQIRTGQGMTGLAAGEDGVIGRSATKRFIVDPLPVESLAGLHRQDEVTRPSLFIG